MSKHLKNVAIKAFALACAAGLSLNGFALAAGASARVNAKSAGTTVALPAVPDPSPDPAKPMGNPAKDNMSMQSGQGKRYGQPGFVGEAINLNVVNADIRDILNYITEQYGINFVIDNSVTAVPVTVNVQDVPWNIALDMILKANRLGIDVNGNILRVATTETLAKEADTMRLMKDSQLSNSPLITELVRLNYARASGTLAGAAGSTGAFAGGATNLSYSGGAGGDLSGGGGDQGILPIIKRRLSRLGSVEVMGQSNSLIITDVKENVEAIRQLIAILDQPEPQVEIETRIVIAQHNFSRDLGAQLSLGVVNLGTGGLANVSTLPASGSTGGSGGSGGSGGGSQGATLTAGPNPFSVFGGLGNTAMPLNNLRSAAATTVIGLTTGLFGTAQISALISAAENRGEVKTVATPRVTALNNRPAQIESGSQIPVQTTQAAGGTAVVTTTFVSVPLRLSITPQITDAGTVVLRVTIENNTVNTGIAVGGVPGIDTQRMQSEVLVPDGGTTVMGGVLADSEATQRQRTPGVASLPIIGNMFKRKLVTKDSTEILFFITPHIYRPDYFGHPMANKPSDGPRMTSVPQPVPLGNPLSNSQPNEQQEKPQVPSTNPQPNVLGAPTQPAPSSAGSARPDAVGGKRP
ncbi:MAG TPA: type IV pilus secretin PilQ [Pyrinomonadaceae bacterium]|jgi:type IV pilus assembly protein PilQ|nr:type IV pilus secretin PilQ [Pyrinomonadaceae bacterium]